MTLEGKIQGILKGKIKMITGNYRDTSYIMSSEKQVNGSDEGAEELSTTINCTTTNMENSIMPDDNSPRQNLNNVYL